MKSTVLRALSSCIAALLWVLVTAPQARAGGSSDLREVSTGLARSTAAGDVLLEVKVSGGYSASSRFEIRLQGDGRLQETTTFVRSEPARAPESRERVLAAEETDRLFADLVAAGLAGLTNDEFLHQLQGAYPSTVLLLGGSDCATTTILLRLYTRAGDGLSWEKIDTDLRLECAFGYERAFPGVPSAQAVGVLVRRLKSLVRSGGEE